ncbi:hypothetical protein ILUMI_18697 [Ignelater luminosus]|uniref:Uncharacterized protein n=1 Tax=Ignelater luminosus TaxID=2038154 RepID=A0A8K0G6A9_IGNLU|nr:hypothetical protein ILUMI_18697 [Ignelater luminosus]
MEKLTQPPTRAKTSRKTKFAAFLGTSSIFVGIILILLRNWIPQYALTSIFVLKPNTLFANTWRKMPVTVPTDVYFFNWTNAEDFHDINIKPRFEQVGPYRFLQNMEKVNVVWNENNTVTFNQVRYWNFDDKYTKRMLSDKITSMNAITLVRLLKM